MESLLLGPLCLATHQLQFFQLLASPPPPSCGPRASLWLPGHRFHADYCLLSCCPGPRPHCNLICSRPFSRLLYPCALSDFGFSSCLCFTSHQPQKMCISSWNYNPSCPLISSARAMAVIPPKPRGSEAGSWLLPCSPLTLYSMGAHMVLAPPSISRCFIQSSESYL